MDDAPRFTPEDQGDRELAVGTFDRNVIVTAGAGTGKTTLLVDRLLHLLMRNDDPLAITEIVALTFTNKAADEMKSRLGEALEGLRHEAPGSAKTGAFMDRYGLSRQDIETRAEAALRRLERAEIGTLHHFATALLRRYPIEAGVDPQFRVDTGERWAEDRFDENWSAWLEEELKMASPRKARWQAALGQFSLGDLRHAALALASETAAIEDLKARAAAVPQPIAQWLQTASAAAENVLQGHPESRNAEKMTAAAKMIFQAVLERGALEAGEAEAERALLAGGKRAAKVKGWSDEEIEEANGLIRIAQGLLQIDPPAIENLLVLLAPFVHRYRKAQTKEGAISFDALLVRARDLLRDHRDVREALKARYRAILIDEFQDTDPVQYEILFYLSEAPAEALATAPAGETGTPSNMQASDWRALRLAPGKLFVVGDPKQSIYGFRRADIAATQAVRETILKQGGVECRLTTNFRSHAALLDPVNSLFENLIAPKDGLQPDYIPIHPAAVEFEGSPFRKLACQWVETGAEAANAEEARRVEGEALARWLSETVIGKAVIHGGEGRARTVQKGDVAILMRRLTGVHYYLEPLRRWGIRYVVEGERRFYRSQEVADAVNLIRAVADPNDRMALVGVLRSPVGGLSDAEILALHRQGPLHYQQRQGDIALQSNVQTLFRILDRLHGAVHRLPVGEAVARIFEETGIALLVAGGAHGEQALANVEKIRRDAQALGLEAKGSFRAVAAALAEAVLEGREEAESPLAEAGVDAVKVFSIHKAKGLEFPVVVLAGSHAGTAHPPPGRVAVRHEGLSAISGLRVGDVGDLASVYLAEKERRREIEEEKRVLYVAMTRAKEHLTLFGADKLSRGSFFSLLEEAMGKAIPEAASSTLALEKGAIEVQRITMDMSDLHRSASKKRSPPKGDWTAWARQWEAGQDRCAQIQGRRRFVNPSVLKQMDAAKSPPRKAAQGGGGRVLDLGSRVAERGKWIGRLAHLFLEALDFTLPTDRAREGLADFLKAQPLPLEDHAAAEIAMDLEELFDSFFRSPIYRTLSAAKILGREIPFLMPWEDRVMSGVIDIAYESEGALYVADYKTDRIAKTTLAQAAEKYRHQSLVYPEALRRALKRDMAAVEFIFLRAGASVRVPIPPPLTKGD